MNLSLQHQGQCFTRPVRTSVLTGAVLTGLSAMQTGVGPHLPVAFATNVSIIYGYHVLQCPMEAVHGRQSAWHNVLSAGSLGAWGVSRGLVGVPLVDRVFYLRYPQISPPLAGFLVYGAGAGALASVLGGKPF